jgi:hypothetical protein
MDAYYASCPLPVVSLSSGPCLEARVLGGGKEQCFRRAGGGGIRGAPPARQSAFLQVPTSLHGIHCRYHVKGRMFRAAKALATLAHEPRHVQPSARARLPRVRGCAHCSGCGLPRKRRLAPYIRAICCLGTWISAFVGSVVARGPKPSTGRSSSPCGVQSLDSEAIESRPSRRSAQQRGSGGGAATARRTAPAALRAAVAAPHWPRADRSPRLPALPSQKRDVRPGLPLPA